jgi:shikimate kinase
MVLVLVGMSGVGKSFHAAALARRGFVHHDIDADIAGRVPELATPLPGERPVETVGRWMGMPWTESHFEREEAYLALEADLTAVALERAAEPGEHVIDTTGSAVHLPDPLKSRIHALSVVVYLDAGPHAERALLDRYLREPKPVIWGQAWAPRPDETPEATLARCYPELLSRRDRLYRALAHHVVDARRVTTDDLALLAR